MTSPVTGKTASSVACAPEVEIWLRGNTRPALILLAATALMTVFVGTACMAIQPPGWVVGVIAAVTIVSLAAAAGTAWVAARPRLSRRGGLLEIRLSPLRVERVPLEVVECVFPGSHPLENTAAAPERRVETLVLRLAERATEWRSRPAAPWGSWRDGSVVCDGRWCEPLSQALARDISGKLLEARRAGRDAAAHP